MLAQRIATALVMLIVMVAALAAPGHGAFEWLMLLVIAAAVWEWARLSGVEGASALGLGLGAAALMAALLWQQRSGVESTTTATEAAFWWFVSAVWIVAGAVVLQRGVNGWRAMPSTLRVLIGMALLVVAWVAITRAERLGFNFLMSALALIWASDIAAYFGGRALGGRLFGVGKLAPSISPGKTREGAVSGLLGALALATVWTLWIDPRWGGDAPGLYTRLVQGQGWVVMLLAVTALTAAGIVGDLFESLVKRAAGAKDSSRLLPGHGGVLDRIDALLPTLPMAMALAAWTSP